MMELADSAHGKLARQWESSITTRRRMRVDKELPVGPEYGELLSRIIESATA